MDSTATAVYFRAIEAFDRRPGHPRPDVLGIGLTYRKEGKLRKIHLAMHWADVRSGQNRIALSAAVRGTAAMAVPFLVLRWLGHPAEAILAGVAGLNVSIADSGGPYRTRFAAMGLTITIMPAVVFAGTQVQGIWWLQALLMFSVAFAGGLLRTLGQVGTSLGLISGIIFLIGMHLPGSVQQSLMRAGAYFAGGMWAVLLTLVIWRARPYKRVELEISTSLEATAALVAAARGLCPAQDERAAGCEQELDRRNRDVRAAVEQARAALGEALRDEGADTTAAKLVVLLSAAEGISAAMLHLGEALNTGLMETEGLHLRLAAADLLAEHEAQCRAMGTALIRRRRNGSLDEARRHMVRFGRGLETLRERPAAEADAGPPAVETILTALNQALHHLENAAEALERLLGQDRRMRGLLPPLHAGLSAGNGLDALAANLTFDSLILRHALRLGLITAAGVLLYTLLHMRNGIWIPLTSLIVLQPNFGATLQRAVNRTAGTMLGAALAALAAFLLQDTPAGMDAAIVVSMFCTILFFRRHYGVAVVFLTPMIILLLDLVLHTPWIEVTDRIQDTAIGAAIALVSGYLLWPLWEGRSLPSRFAAALRANRDYLQAVIAARQAGRAADAAEARRRAEIETDNFAASFQRMQGEPRRSRLAPERSFSQVVLVRRLNRHITQLALHLDELPADRMAAESPTEALADSLAEIAAALESGQPPPPVADPTEQAAAVRSALWHGATDPVAPGDSGRPDPRSVRATIDYLFERIAGDISDLQTAADFRPDPV